MNLRFVKINNDLWTVARNLEDFSAYEEGPYEVYIFDGDTAGPRHPGTVVVRTLGQIMADPISRRMFGLHSTDFAKLPHKLYKPNDQAIDYMVASGLITKHDMNIGFKNLNLFNRRAAQAVIGFLNKNPDYVLKDVNCSILGRQFTGCTFERLQTQKKEKRSTTSLLGGKI